MIRHVLTLKLIVGVVIIVVRHGVSRNMHPDPDIILITGCKYLRRLSQLHRSFS
jgi:hypothetical protein